MILAGGWNPRAARAAADEETGRRKAARDQEGFFQAHEALPELTGLLEALSPEAYPHVVPYLAAALARGAARATAAGNYEAQEALNRAFGALRSAEDQANPGAVAEALETLAEVFDDE